VWVELSLGLNVGGLNVKAPRNIGIGLVLRINFALATGGAFPSNSLKGVFG
jgi:hypothetical protein